jgi:hypothetical protein
MDPMEFRILNAYRDGDMKAHRREAKNTALIECVQVAAEKAKWKIGEEFKRASSLKDGGGERAQITLTPRDAAVSFPARPAAAAQQRTSYDRGTVAPLAPEPTPPPPRPQAPPPAPASSSHGATRFSSVFGRRR